jgi:Na+/H+ antiporter NhaD/arsenite permease-like protein
VFLPKNIQEIKIAGVLTIPALVMVLAAVGSYFTTKKEVHASNDFNFGPVKEVGYLFVGIFLTMIPALQLLQSGTLVKIDTPMQYYFSTGALSAFLDNAPTYLSFLAAAMGAEGLSVESVPDVLKFAGQSALFLMAISLGAVFFGAGSYIGNGPNFMVKAIAEKAKVSTPSFLGYIFKYSLPILVPILVVVGFFVLRGTH